MTLREELAEVAPELLDGDQLLTEVREWFGRFIRTMSGADLDLLALWAMHTHVVIETYTTPRLQLDSPMPGSGKTTCLEHLQRLCRHPVQMASLSSSALLTRMLKEDLRTLLIDEADRALNPKLEGVGELLAVINSGYKRGGTRPVLVPIKGGGWKPEEMPTFAPVAIAGNQPDLPEDTRSRIIRVLLLPDMDGLIEESDWELIEPDAVDLAERIATWADQVRDQLRECRPPLPDGITGRFREKWAPLRRVAEMCGGRWPAAVDAMAVHDREQYEMDKEDGMIKDRPAILLLRHLLELWPTDQDFMATADLIDKLAAEHPSAWGDEGPFGKSITPHRLGRMLAGSYKVHSSRQSRTGPRGYLRSHLVAVWSRMVPTPLPETGASGATGDTGAESGAGYAACATSAGSRETPTATGAVVPETNGHGPVQAESITREACQRRPRECSNSNCRAFNACVDRS